MHEAALASSVAQVIRERALSGVRIRLYVSGGHSDVDAFDAALRFNLAASDPEIDLDAITIEHLAEERLCLSCGRSFAAIGRLGECPRCGGVGPAQSRPERIEIGSNERTAGAGWSAGGESSSSAARDVRVSQVPGALAQAEHAIQLTPPGRPGARSKRSTDV
jgi:Zn finger protein HypA/HybF involved in hydrogenase expression